MCPVFPDIVEERKRRKRGRERERWALIISPFPFLPALDVGLGKWANEAPLFPPSSFSPVGCWLVLSGRALSLSLSLYNQGYAID